MSVAFTNGVRVFLELPKNFLRGFKYNDGHGDELAISPRKDLLLYLLSTFNRMILAVNFLTESCPSQADKNFNSNCCLT